MAEKLVKYSDNGTSTSSVNFPEVALPAHPGKHRLLHIHRNVPGVLSDINRVFADNSINISAQYLQTNEKVGYVVIDVDAALLRPGAGKAGAGAWHHPQPGVVLSPPAVPGGLT